MIADHDLSSSDDTWACEPFNDLLNQARYAYWAIKIFQQLGRLPF